MAETVTVTEKVKTSSGRGWLIFWTVLIVVAIIIFAWVLMNLHKRMFSFNMTTVAANVATLVTTPPNPFPVGITAATATNILNEQIQTILKNRMSVQAIQNYASISGMPAEQVLVNEAYTQCHNYGWI